MCIKLYKSVQDSSNSNLHSCKTLFWLKKVVKRKYYKHSGLGLAWDRIEVYKITQRNYIQWNCIQKRCT